MPPLSNTTAAPLVPAGRLPLPSWRPTLPGVALSAAIAIASLSIARLPALQNWGISALVLAMAIGMAVGHTVYAGMAGACAPGIGFTKQKLLRLGIVLYGLRLTFHDIGSVGLGGVLIDALMVVSTFCLALVIGKRVLKLDRNTVLLIGAGSSICGAAAVLATDPVIKGRPEQVTVAVSTVVIFGTLATFIYPLLYQLNGVWSLLPGSVSAFGVYAGSTIHEVAQVIAVARAVDAGAVDTAVIAKMVRVMMLCPFLLSIAVYIALADNAGAAQDRPAGFLRMPAGAVLVKAVPWFAFGFVAVVGLNSLVAVPAVIVRSAASADMFFLMMAMAALGLSTHISAFRLAGFKPILLAAILFFWLVLGGAWINHVVPGLVA